MGRIFEAGMNGAPPAMAIASPINDVQIVAVMATQLNGTAAERVGFAMQLVVESIVQMQGGITLAALVRKKQAEKADER